MHNRTKPYKSNKEDLYSFCQRLADPNLPGWNKDLDDFIQILKPICASCIKVDYQNKTAWSAEDLLQQFLYKMILSHPPKILEYDKNKGDFYGWIKKTCLNLVLEKTRTKKSNPEIRVFLDNPNLDPEWIDRTYNLGMEDAFAEVFKLDEIALKKCIQELSQPRDRQIMYLKLIEDMSNMDIAISIGYPLKEGTNPLSSFNKSLHNAKCRLRAKLIEAGYYPQNNG